VAENFDLGLTAHYTNSIGRITGDSFNPVTFASAPSARQTRIATLQYETRGTAHLVLWDGRLEQTLGFAYGSNIIATQDPNNGNGRTNGDRVKVDWQGNGKLAEGETLVLGAETSRDALHRGLSFGFPTSLSQGITTNAGYAEIQTDLPIGFHNSFSLRDDDNSRFGNRVTWRMAPSWVIESTGTTLRASAGSGFKAPALQQLFGTFGGNANLKPETSTGYEAGFEQKILGDDLLGGVTLFHNDIKNLITSGPAPTFQNINIGRARTQGVEAFLAWKPLDTLSLHGATRRALLRRPRHKASLGADWQATEDLSLDATLLYVGPQIDGNRDFSIPRKKMPDYVTLDVAASYKLTDMWSVFGRIENATDTNYQSPSGFLRPGIGAYGGIKVNL
jgi:vitamin B12 transporter